MQESPAESILCSHPPPIFDHLWSSHEDITFVPVSRCFLRWLTDGTQESKETQCWLVPSLTGILPGSPPHIFI